MGLKHIQQIVAATFFAFFSSFSPFSLKNMIKIAEKFAQFKKTSYLCTRQKEMTQTTRLREVSALFPD